MAICTYHKDADFQNAIIEYQNHANVKPLEEWIDNQNQITDPEQIYEMLHQVFMISDSYFSPNSLGVFAKAFDKSVISEDFKFKNPYGLCLDVWLEHPHDFANFFHSYEKLFTKNGKVIGLSGLHTIEDHLANERVSTELGFWRAIYQFHTHLSFDDIDSSNFIPNFDLWLSKVPKAKEFLKPYCPNIKQEPNFCHVAYAFLTHGKEIQTNILNLVTKGNPYPIQIFKKAAQYYELEQSLAQSSNNKIKKKI